MAFPPLDLGSWRPTRDALHGYARVLGRTRQALTPSQRHWWHVTLRLTATGLHTPPIPAADGSFELGLDLVGHQAWCVSTDGEEAFWPFENRSPLELAEWVTARARRVGADLQLDRSEFAPEPVEYDGEAANRYLHALVPIDQAFKAFSGALRGRTGPVQLFPHHFDLSVNWFSGRLVPGQDPDDEENADEQMNFGFATGDSTIPEPYFYATAYPLPDGLSESEMPRGAYWQSEGFQGAVLPYAALVGAETADRTLSEFLGQLHREGSRRMQ